MSTALLQLTTPFCFLFARHCLPSNHLWITPKYVNKQNQYSPISFFTFLCFQIFLFLSFSLYGAFLFRIHPLSHPHLFLNKLLVTQFFKIFMFSSFASFWVLVFNNALLTLFFFLVHVGAVFRPCYLFLSHHDFLHSSRKKLRNFFYLLHFLVSRRFGAAKRKVCYFVSYKSFLYLIKMN